jgi:thiol-disulfide isomerase/thioredoxin
MQKTFFLPLIFLFLLACNDHKKNVEVQEKTAISHIYAEEIPVLDFEAFAPLLHQENDTTYVINFWATWCKPCVKELPAFEKINEKYAGEKVQVVLVSLDFPNQLETRLIPFIKKHNIRSKVVFLSDGNANEWIPKVNAEWSGSIPATIIYNKNNRKFREGAYTYSELEKELASFLKEQ